MKTSPADQVDTTPEMRYFLQHFEPKMNREAVADATGSLPIAEAQIENIMKGIHTEL